MRTLLKKAFAAMTVLLLSGTAHMHAQDGPFSLPYPENISESIDYDDLSGNYLRGLKLNGTFLEVPTLMTPKEYASWKMRQDMNAYFHDKYSESLKEQTDDKFDFTNMKFDLGPAEKIFGPGGVQIRTSGSASIKLGYNHTRLDNPSLSMQNRKNGSFDFDEQINLSISGSVGDKINLDLNYNTEATFDFDAKKIKLRYEGKEDEIIRLLEAGNVSFPSNSSLIQGATSLFGIRSDLQFGKLNLQLVLSQKESTSTSVSSKGGQQITDFEIDASNYDENRHFFLGHFFRDRYDENMSMLPAIVSGIQITRIEVWVTNRKSSYDNPRNIVAFTDLGESEHISNPMWRADGGPAASNGANDLYRTLLNRYSEARDIDRVATTLGESLTGSTDYEKISNARKLDSNEYTLNSTLGYISLKTALTSDQVLAVAYEYTWNGGSYQVGEFSQDNTDSSQALFVKLLKSNSNSPGSGTWDLMMKNVYAITQGTLTDKEFKLSVCYASDSAGSRLTYLPESSLKGTPLLKLLGLDRLDNNQNAHSNGQFDYVESYTVQSQAGRIIFPVIEPFGSHLEQAIGDRSVAARYAFNELYDSTRTVARRIADKDKFFLVGQYSGSDPGILQLGSYNIPKGSVTVTAGGATLMENVDYTVDYSMGIVTIINQSILDAGTPVNVQLESNTEYSMQRKTMAGMNWTYTLSPDLKLGGTLMHLNEKPLTSKVTMGDEPLVNTMYGLNIDWRHQSQGLTKLVDLLPFVNATQPSSISFQAEMAALKSSVSDQVQGSSSYIDDFESAESGISIKQPSAWSLAAVPFGMKGYGMSGQVQAGYNRALLNWFAIDPLFTSRSSSLTPSHIKNDLDQLSNHYVREIYERELYPNKESSSSESTTMQVLNLAYYPSERGPYNLNPELDANGMLPMPEQNWGGIMRRLSTTDFEQANIEYIEFWMLDPFIYNTTSSGGDLYLNLGEVSEDVLSDGKKFFENGLPANGDSTLWASTVWGKVPTGKSLVYAFDNADAGARQRQDVGLNGLSSEEERQWPAYADYLNAIKGRVNADAYNAIYEDPAGDTYHHFRGSDYDDARLSVLDRYRRFNGTEGNSPNLENTGAQYDMSARTTPDTEDANQDYTLDEYEKFFQYRISLRPQDLEIGRNFIADKRTVKVKLRNGDTETVNWYCFRVPITEYESVIGQISDFSSIRFMRMYLTGFREPVNVRFATLDLMTSQWRNYEQAIASISNRNPGISGTFSATSVNIEENGDRSPVNYIMPPGITRILDPDQAQLIQDNEQAMSLQVNGLGAGEARGIYKKSNLDLRKYGRIQMFAHAEAPYPDDGTLKDGDLSVFVRFGSDYSGNYYEYEIPLALTPAGRYSGNSESDRRIVWPESNMLDIDLEILTAVKNRRNEQRNLGAIGAGELYSEYDPDNPENRISIAGNPTLGSVRAIMIGVRNNSMTAKSGQVWVNEMRLVGFESKGGAAAQSKLSVKLSDVANIDMSGRLTTAGFGGLEESIGQRKTDNFYQYNMSTSFNLGRFLPENAKVSVPVYYSYSRQQKAPQYSPYDTDLMLDDVLDSYTQSHARDSVRSISQELTEQKNISISGAKVNIKSKTPMPYDPANFSVSYSRSTGEHSSSTVDYEHDLNWNAQLGYNYSSGIKGWKPFGESKIQSKWFDAIRETTINPLPQNISFNTNLQRIYHELQERDLESGQSDGIPVSFSQQYRWNRDLAIKWDPTRLLKMSLSARTGAEIEEPYTIVNRDLYPDRYQMWKDSVKMSLMSMGRPLDYNQSFQASYTMPLDKIPVLDWVTADGNFSSSYSWARGTTYADGSSYGNIISTRRNLTANGRLNLVRLYNKVTYLQRLNNRYSQAKKPAGEAASKKKEFKEEMLLVPDSVYIINHKLGTVTTRLTATGKDGKTVKLRYRTIDKDSISFRVKDTTEVMLRISQDPDRPAKTSGFGLREGIDMGLRVLMMVRAAQFSYRNDYSMSLPGFMPQSKNFGQNSMNGLLAPGLGFAFGLTDDSYIDRAISNGWLLGQGNVAHTAASAHNEDFQLKMTVEPWRDINISANASWTKTLSNQVQYMYEGRPTNRSGSFNMTVMSIGSAFERHSADGGYHSRSFDKFVNSLETFRSRLEQVYTGGQYPMGTSLAGQTYNPENGSVDKYSGDVLIPAFLAAYTGGRPEKAGTDIIPSILSMMPNWTFTYSGLAKLPVIQKYFKSFNLRHAYKSVYSTGSFGTFNSYVEFMNGHGFIEDVASGMPVPSGMYNLGSVSINESFAPLAGLDMTFKNGISARFEYRKTRILTLSTTSVQVVETFSDDITAGTGFKLDQIKMLGAQTGSGRNKVSNDLNVNIDFSYRNQSALCRNIRDMQTQATSGNRAIKASLQADYTYSRMLTLNFYYDYQSNFPLVSTSSYPTSTHDCGITLKFTLTR